MYYPFVQVLHSFIATLSHHLLQEPHIHGKLLLGFFSLNK